MAGRYQPGTKFTGIGAVESGGDRAAPCAVEKIGFVREGGVALTQAALRFVPAHDAVASVMPGVRDAKQLAENLAAADGAMPAEIVQRLRGFWRAELESDPLPW